MNYLTSLKNKSESHQKRFALATSGAITLSIFAFWALANFGTGGLATINPQPAAARSAEVSPLASLKEGFVESLNGLTETLGSITTNFSQTVNLQKDYLEMKSDVLNTYGQ